MDTRMLSIWLCCAAFCAGAAESVVTDDVVIPAEGLTIDVASGDVATYTGCLSGTGKLTKTGGGKLVLAGANTFSGGVEFAAGIVQADCAGALGTGKVIVQTGAGGLYLNAPGATFPNQLQKCDGSTTFIRFMADTTLAGTVRADYNCDPELIVDAGVTATFDGSVYGRPNSFRGFQLNSIGGTLAFRRKLAIPSLRDGGNGESNLGGIVELWSGENDFAGAGGIDFAGLRYVCRGANVLGNAVLNRSGNRDYRSELDLGGFDQTIRSFTYNASNIAWIDAVGGTITSATPATLTVQGSGEDQVGNCNFAVNGNVSMVLDADPSYRLNFLHRINGTTGDISVVSGHFSVGGSGTTFRNVERIGVSRQGRFALESTSEGALSGLKALTVESGGRFSVSSSAAQPFTAGQVAVALQWGAQIELPETMRLEVASFSLGGELQPPGEYTSEKCSEIVSGKIVVPGAVERAATWSCASGADCRVSLSDNWISEDPFSIEGTRLNATFAAAGDRAVVDVAVDFASIAMTVPSFTFDGAEGGRMTVGKGGISVVPSEGAETRLFAFDAPLGFTADQTFEIPGNAAFAFSRLDGTDKVALTKAGSGRLELRGTNVISGRLNVGGGDCVMSGLVTTPSGIVSVDPASTVPMDEAMDFSARDAKSVVLAGVTIDKPFFFASRDGVYHALTFALGATNEFRSVLANANYSSQGFWMERDSVLITSGGVQQVAPWYIMGHGTWIVREKPIRWYSSNMNKWLTLDSTEAAKDSPQRLRLVLETTGNLHNFDVRDYGATIDCRVDNAFAAGARLKMDARWNGYSRLLLHSTTQRFDQVDIRFSGLPSDYAYGRCEVCGEAGAALGVCGSADSLVDAPIVGDVSILKSGTGTLTMTNRVFASTGGIHVSGGKMVFKANASWLGGKNVAVCGSGRLELPATAVFGEETCLTLADDGVLAIAPGTTFRVREAWVDGNRLSSGRYAYATAPESLRRHLASGSGELVVRSGGAFVIIVR